MADEAKPTDGRPAEIVARMRPGAWEAVPFVLPIAILILYLVILLGLRDTLGTLAAFIALGVASYMSIRCEGLRRAVYNDEGMTLSSRGIGGLMIHRFHFRWDEVLEFRRSKLRQGPVRLRLNRPWKFWTFHSQPLNAISIPKVLWENPAFAEVIRGHVPAERIHVEERSWWERYWRASVLVILLCAVLAGACSLAAFRTVDCIWGTSMALITLNVGSMAMFLCNHRAREGFRLVQLLLHTLFLFVAVLGFLVFRFPAHGVALVSGYLAATAGALIGAVLVMINGRKSAGWPHACAALILSAAGFAFGWTCSPQTKAIRLGAGVLDFHDPWTPKGDAFMMKKGDSEELYQPWTVCWYSSDGNLQRSATMPAGAYLRMIGEDAALFTTPTEDGSQLWIVPRRAEARVIAQTPRIGAFRVASDSSHALVPLSDARGKPASWLISDLGTGSVEPVNFPVPLRDISVLALRNDGSVIWLTGSRPLDQEKNPASRGTGLPASGEFPYPGTLCRIWLWKVNSIEPPVPIHSAKTQWLDWQVSLLPALLYVWRVSETPPAHVECVEMDLRRSPPTERVIPESEADFFWPMSDSYDGRFELVTGIAGGISLKDTRTGRKFPLLITIGSIRPWLHWSPVANRFVMEMPELNLRDGFWCWHRNLEKALKGTEAVYFVDMDRQ